jgi:hypothetical protein
MIYTSFSNYFYTKNQFLNVFLCFIISLNCAPITEKRRGLGVSISKTQITPDMDSGLILRFSRVSYAKVHG